MKEKGGVEGECSKSIRHWGWQGDPVRDAVVCYKCGALIYPDSEPGTFDFEAWVPLWEQKKVRHIYIEVKSGRTRLAFGRLSESQSAWAASVDESNDERVDLWMWVCIGEGIGYKKYPRHTYLFPYEMWHQMQKDLDRKSIPHGYEPLEPYRLEWVVGGGGVWLLPDYHPARITYGYQTGVVNGQS